jgi:hypothetical protein
VSTLTIATLYSKACIYEHLMMTQMESKHVVRIKCWHYQCNILCVELVLIPVCCVVGPYYYLYNSYTQQDAKYQNTSPKLCGSSWRSENLSMQSKRPNDFREALRWSNDIRNDYSSNKGRGPGRPLKAVLSNVFIYWGACDWWLWRQGRHVAIAIIIIIIIIIIIK